MPQSSSKKIISHGGIYLLGTILQRCVSLVMLPIYTRCLTPADYGIIELLSMILDFVGIILGLRIGQAIFRFYHEYRDQKDKNEIISTSLYLVAGLNAVGVLFIFALANPLSATIFGDTSQTGNLLLFSFTLLCQGFVEIPMTYIRARQRPWLFVSFSILKLTLQLSLNIYFVVLLKMHVEGVIYSAIISSGTMGLLLGGYALTQTGMRFSIKKAKQLISFSFPLILTSMVAFYITFGDRYFLRFFGSLTEVGIYSLGYKFGFILMFLVVQPFNNIWDSEKYNIYKKKNARAKYQKTFLLFSALTILVCIGISIFVKDLLKIMSDQSFWSASRVVPIILAAYLTNAWCSFVNLGILLKNKTLEITYGTILGAIVITIGYLVLIPLYGVMGAAIATLFGFGSRCVWVYWRAKKLYDMGLQWGKIGWLLLIWIAVSLAAMLRPEELRLSICLDIILMAAACASLILLPIFPEEHRRVAIEIIKRPWRVNIILKSINA